MYIRIICLIRNFKYNIDLYTIRFVTVIICSSEHFSLQVSVKFMPQIALLHFFLGRKTRFLMFFLDVPPSNFINAYLNPE